MRAVVCENGSLSVLERPRPVPEQGQVLLNVVRAGICGSDLHARHHADEQADVLAEAGYTGFGRSHEKVVFGHEFVGTVAAYGPGCRKDLPLGALAVALPLRRAGAEVHAIGLSASAPGAYAEQVLVQESLAFAVPAGLAPETAALTEPVAIGLHAVNRSQIAKTDAAIVVGCGPVGLAVILMLKARGVQTIVASDFSAGRRALALTCGATVAVDPAAASPYDSLTDRGFTTSISGAAEFGITAMGKLRALPVVPWDVAYRVAERVLGGQKRPVVFECVGVPGVIDSIITAAPLGARVVVAGVCQVPDSFRPVMAVNKEIDLRFVVGYTPLEFHDTLRMIAAGKVDPRPLVTATVGLDGVAGAFDALKDPEVHAKVLIDPQSTAVLPR